MDREKAGEHEGFVSTITIKVVNIQTINRLEKKIPEQIDETLKQLLIEAGKKYPSCRYIKNIKVDQKFENKAILIFAQGFAVTS